MRGECKKIHTITADRAFELCFWLGCAPWIVGHFLIDPAETIGKNIHELQRQTASMKASPNWAIDVSADEKGQETPHRMSMF